MRTIDYKFVEEAVALAGGVKGKQVLEVGSRNVNGTIRPVFEGCENYLGIDLTKGPLVDMVADITKPLEPVKENFWDFVVCIGTLEHIHDCHEAVYQMKRMCKVGGTVILTTVDDGFPKHDHPGDFWRFNTEHLKNLFFDFAVKSVDARQEQFVGISAMKVVPHVDHIKTPVIKTPWW